MKWIEKLIRETLQSPKLPPSFRAKDISKLLQIEKGEYVMPAQVGKTLSRIMVNIPYTRKKNQYTGTYVYSLKS